MRTRKIPKKVNGGGYRQTTIIIRISQGMCALAKEWNFRILSKLDLRL